MSETCFILGAGFSALANLPMQQNILANISNKALWSVKKLFGEHSKNIIKNISLEDIFTFIDRAMINNEVVASMDYNNFYQAKNDLLEYIIKIFNQKLKNANLINEYEFFFNKLVENRIKNNASISIISLNWDTLSEFYINKAYKNHSIKRGGVDYSCFDWDYDEKDGYVTSIWRKAKDYNTIKVLKIHGSINWVYNRTDGGLYIREQNSQYPQGIILDEDERKRFEYIMVTPTLLKNLNNTHLKMVWHNTSLDLREATRIVFLGYSFPLADFDFRYVLLKSVMKNKDANIRVLLYPKYPSGKDKYIRDDTENRYKNFFIRHNIDIKFMNIKDFLIDENLILNW